ncbi:PP2C family protein-serine/threonine phosphatase [Nocardioides pyridinolyticus]
MTSSRIDPGLLAGLAVIAALVVLSIVTPAHLIAVFAAGAIVASMLTTARRTAYVAIVATSCGVLARLWDDTTNTVDFLVRVLLCALLGVVAVQAAALSERRESRLRRMTVIAETAQRAVLRAIPTAIGSVGLSARYVSASAEALVGGDLYEVAATPFGVRVIVGDVRGKGLEAVQTAAAVLGAFRAAAFTEPDPAALARSIDETITRFIGDEEFVTAIVGEFHGDRVMLANCGHHPPLLVHDSQVAEVDTGEPTVPLGMGSAPAMTEHAWPTGARMLFFTDGLVEARDRSGEFFPLDEFAAELGEGSLEDALDHLVERLLEYAGGRMNDDLALVLAESESAR